MASTFSIKPAHPNIDVNLQTVDEKHLDITDLVYKNTKPVANSSTEVKHGSEKGIAMRTTQISEDHY